jgi:phenylpropionate dioxygenase-like ring-hydroxylating dioxygenase large terminal subunit
MRALRDVEDFSPAEGELAKLVREALAGSSSRVEDAWTLPPRTYMSQEFYDLEVEKVFKKGWICVGHVAQIPNVGDYFTQEVLGEPMVIVRGEDRVRALSSVCLHRWAPVVSGTGNARILSCPFHKWGYALDGQLLGAPFMDQAEGFAPKECRLPEFRSEIVADLGLIFVTFNPDISPISERIESLCARARAEGWDMADQVIVDVVDQDNKYNWKIQVETYMECYHHIGAHLKSLEADSPGGRSWCEEDMGSWTVCHWATKPGATPEELEEKPSGNLVLVYPLLMMGVNHKHAGFRILFPEGPNRTKSRIFSMMRRAEVEAPDFEEKLAKGRAMSEIINQEDNAVNDMQQIGAGSAVAEIGRFSHLEASSWHMAEHIRQCIRTNE